VRLRVGQGSRRVLLLIFLDWDPERDPETSSGQGSGQVKNSKFILEQVIIFRL
jgi:hypothetical protein|tara:strand:- start:93 stop:251 length:159 start_codon:yes stop_codon:yes gene_type:complete